MGGEGKGNKKPVGDGRRRRGGKEGGKEGQGTFHVVLVLFQLVLWGGGLLPFLGNKAFHADGLGEGGRGGREGGREGGKG